MHKEKTVIPVQVTEKLLRTTLEGESISYIVQIPTKNKNSRNLDTIDASVYEDTDSIKIAMLENATRTIDNIVDKASRLAGKLLPQQVKNNDEEMQLYDSQSVNVDLGNGMVGKLSIDSLEEEMKNAKHIT
tara:strand:- start:154 stop:546 length:393 start_codon:yes stop_codon:yes gene_type:complete